MSSLAPRNASLNNFPGWKYYLVFAVCGFSNALFFWVRLKSHLCASCVVNLYPPPMSKAFLPETKGVPLEELDAYFDNIPIFVPGAAVQTLDANTREEELRRGKVMAREGAESVEDEKDNGIVIEHV